MSDKPPFRMTGHVVQVLLALAEEPSHGYGLMGRIEEATGGRLKVGPGALHLTLSKLLSAGLAEEVPTAAGPGGEESRRRTFRITTAGRRLLAEELQSLADLVDRGRAIELLRESGH